MMMMVSGGELMMMYREKAKSMQPCKSTVPVDQVVGIHLAMQPLVLLPHD